MIRLYDIGQDKKYGYPKLIVIKEFKMDVNISDRRSLVTFMNEKIHLNEFDNEHSILITTDMYNNVIGVFLISIGDYKSCNIYYRNIATFILLSGGRKFLIAHNHPDKALYFSEDDKCVVGMMRAISTLIETEFVNSYIVTSEGYITNDMDRPIRYGYRRK